MHPGFLVTWACSGFYYRNRVIARKLEELPIDFGSAHFEGATRLTWQSLPPGTPEYLSPQACRFEIGLARHRDTYYPPCPADDLYALGVTAYRLVMGEYPPPLDALEDEEGAWHVISPDLRSLLAGNPRVGARLRDLILRLLSEVPEARGTATQAAEELEAVAEERVPQLPAEPPPAAEVPPPNVPAAPSGSGRPEPVRPPEQTWAWKPWLPVVAAAGFAVFLWNLTPVPGPPQQRAADFQKPDAGTSAVGDTSPAELQAPTKPSQEKKPVAQQPLPEPRPGQTRPDKSGRCPGRKQVLINGGCWGELLPMSAEECAENDGVLFKGKCYAPVFATPRKAPPTSSPPEAR